ncbi:hypothetical protein BH11MYX1_BH11MYX1_55410 [soil metagenome]
MVRDPRSDLAALQFLADAQRRLTNDRARPYAATVVRWCQIVVGLVVGVGALAGCRQLAGIDDPITVDGRGALCYGTGLVQVCFDVEPAGAVELAQDLDTASASCSSHVVSNSGAEACVVAASKISLAAGARTYATGADPHLPLVLVAVKAITIAGTLDVAGHRDSLATPAGGAYLACLTGTDASSGAYGGGGQGGSFLDEGGDGGAGGGTIGGQAGNSLGNPVQLHGGCNGRAGGNVGGAGGLGGGAVYLIANTSISIAGRVDASGGGGGAATVIGAGGGAGGSGGAIGIDAPSVEIAGAVCAIGGSGAAGSSTGPSVGGGDAVGGTTSCAAGDPGTADPDAGAGGLGALNGMAQNGHPGVAGGGGGGGGSSGYIRIDGARAGSGDVQPPG